MKRVQQRLHDAALKLFVETGSRHLNVSDLAKEAGVVRGTVYNNLEDPENFFDQVAQQVVAEMNERIKKRLTGIDDPAEQYSITLRAPLQRVMDEPVWGRFLVQFAIANPILNSFWRGYPASAIAKGIETDRFELEVNEAEAFLAQGAGATFALMILVLNGEKTWRAAGEELVFWQLRALGLGIDDAREIARRKLPSCH
ncbi:TetR/AcrR family transcriptional regulator [Shimia thalassica]|uniref:TetR/AcrR family transcriptional regulator n=1 Tax=Shimia thalassica TaxID=1715693 RepID=UPI0026E371F1|nr:TetR/AcrR family transcriptional regulator [Shimia thalassica]MDO6481733.1 TetR/AcrR family transcriptional regulator [Shimia thalassica]MDO6523819.1 TetR/AcrR family transcriptional regulator [Shimia thalassica]MDP2582255.1 TetR/AcrR family transcriptional regulator [Shimia thalassica]